MIFFEDGTFLYNFFDLNSSYPGNTSLYLKKVSGGEGTEIFYKSFYWGIYRIEGDTIIAQYLSNAALLAPWEAWEMKFKVVNITTLELLKDEIRPLFPTTDNEKRFIQKANSLKKFLPARYIYSPYIPPPNSWLKKERWIWCVDTHAGARGNK